MPDISKVRISGTVYDLKDVIARQMAASGDHPGDEPGEDPGGSAGYEVVEELPDDPQENVLYVLKGGDGYTIYVYDDTGWHQVAGAGGGSGVWYSESEDDPPPDGYDIWIMGGEGETGITIPDVTVQRVSDGVKITADSGSGVTEATVRDGRNFAIKAYYDSAEELALAVPNPGEGDTYGVGEEAPYDMYVWDDVHELWVNNGPISGVPGADGVSPVITVNKVGGVTTLTIQNADGTEDEVEINDGQDGLPGTDGTNGSPGSTPVKGTDYWTAADKAEIVQDVLNALPEWTGGSY